jgi:hypothetical protein
MRTAAWKESACRIPIEKKRTASVSGEASYLRVKRKAMNVCGMKPPPRLSNAKRPLSRATIPRERCRGDRIEKQPLWRRTGEGDQGA